MKMWYSKNIVKKRMRKELKDFFIPHERNDYKPHSLQKAAMAGMVVLVVLSFTLANLQSIIWITSDWMVSTILPSVIVELTNDERSDENLNDLRRSVVLDAAAQLKAQHMAENEYFAHYSPTGISPWHWFSLAEYNFVHAGENLAIHFTDSDEVVDAWMDSPTHRANIMNGDFTEIGVGAASGSFEGYKTVYVVQLFGTPAAPVPVTTAETPTPEPVVLAEAETEISEEVLVVAPEETNPQIAGSEDEVVEVGDTEVSLSTARDPIEVVPTTTEADIATPTEIAEVVATEESVVLYSDLISTSTGGVPATIDPTKEISESSKPAGMLGMLTRPQAVLQILYSMIAFFVVVALLLAIFIEIRQQRPVQVVYSAGLMAVMAGLFYVHAAISSGALIV